MKGHREYFLHQQQYPSMFKLTLGAEQPPSVKEMDRLLSLVRQKHILQEQGTTYDSSEARNHNKSKKRLQEITINENDPMRIIDNPFTSDELSTLLQFSNNEEADQLHIQPQSQQKPNWKKGKLNSLLFDTNLQFRSNGTQSKNTEIVKTPKNMISDLSYTEENEQFVYNRQQDLY